MSKASAAQRRYIQALANGTDVATFASFYATAAARNGNAPMRIGETPTQAARRLTRSAASSLIDALVEAGVTPGKVADPYAKAPKKPFLDVYTPARLEPVEGVEVDDELTY